MKTLSSLLLILVLGLSACDKENVGPDDLSLEKGAERLSDMRAKLLALSSSVACVNPNDFKFSAYGNKSCGGPTGYLPYEISIEDIFLEKVKEYTDFESAYNRKWGIISTCDVPVAPDGIVCEEGKAVLDYLKESVGPDDLSEEEAIEWLNDMYEELQALSSSVACENPNDFKFSAVGSKACGGPLGYLPYATSIEDMFLKKVKEYTDFESAFNIKWGVISTCDVTPAPKRVICKQGKAALDYSAR